jgi:diaminopropionate ammonia-lyase
MMPSLTAEPSLVLNPAWGASRPYAANLLSPEEMDDAVREVRQLPGYAPTPLHRMVGFAAALGVGEVWVKDEGARFGMGGVKALGAPYGLHYLLAQQDRPAADCTAVAATDGNHGLALAWAARQFGCQSRIYVGSAVGPQRIQLIQSYGAEVVVINGTYDDAVQAAAAAAKLPGGLLVTDTDYVGDLPVTRAIMAGYSVLAWELAEQVDVKRFSHVFLQCGVGGVAAGITAGLWHRLGHPPRVVTVEPETAACLQASLMAGQPVQIPGSLETRMIGLACGYPSLPAWRILSRAAFAAMTVSEEDAREVQAAMAAGRMGDPALMSGDTGISGIAGFCRVAGSSAARNLLGLNDSSRILLVSSEGPPP